MSKRMRITLEMEFQKEVKDFDIDTIKDALKHFGEYNDNIINIEEVE